MEGKKLINLRRSCPRQHSAREAKTGNFKLFLTQGGLIPRVALLIGLMTLSCGVTLGMARAATKRPAKPPRRNTAKADPSIIKTVFPNGLTLLVKRTDANEVVALNLLARSGPLYETLEQRGISALTQQVLLRGSQKRTAREIALVTESVGAELTAGLGGGYGYVSLTTTTGGLEPALDVLLDLLQQPGFSETELAKEQKMLSDRLLAREDQPFDAAYLNFMELFYAGHPYGVKTAALVTSVNKITRDDLVAWYQKIYVPQNMVISIVGKVDPVAIKQRLAGTLGQLPPGKRPALTAAAARRQSRDLQGFKQRATQGLFLVLGYPAPPLNTRDSLAMEVLNQILGGGSEARLYTELREKRGLVYTVYSHYEKQNGLSHLCAVMATAPRNYQAAREQVARQFRRLAAQPVNARELAMAKQALRGSYLMGHETNNAQSLYLGRYELNGLGYDYDRRFPQLIGQVTAADLRRVARKYFTHCTMSVIAGQPVE
jgi:zinc protease